MTRFGRLLRRADFLRIAAAKKKWVAPGMIVQIDHAGEGIPRLGFTASKKVGNAVKRNRARRRLREAIRKVSSNTEFAGDIVLIARPSTVDRPWADLLEDLETAVKNLNRRLEK